MPAMSDHIRTSKSTLALVVVAIHILWMSVFLLTSSHPLSWAYIHDSASLLWLFELAAVMTLSVSLFYLAVLIKRMMNVLGISIDLLAVFY
jgi:hypothetical protein